METMKTIIFMCITVIIAIITISLIFGVIYIATETIREKIERHERKKNILNSSINRIIYYTNKTDKTPVKELLRRYNRNGCCDLLDVLIAACDEIEKYRRKIHGLEAGHNCIVRVDPSKLPPKRK